MDRLELFFFFFFFKLRFKNEGNMRFQNVGPWGTFLKMYKF
jgi:hypothetical protein